MGVVERIHIEAGGFELTMSVKASRELTDKHLKTFVYKVAFTETRKIDVLRVLLRGGYANDIKDRICEQGRMICGKLWSAIKTRRI